MITAARKGDSGPSWNAQSTLTLRELTVWIVSRVVIKNVVAGSCTTDICPIDIEEARRTVAVATGQDEIVIGIEVEGTIAGATIETFNGIATHGNGGATWKGKCGGNGLDTVSQTEEKDTCACDVIHDGLLGLFKPKCGWVLL